MGQQLILTPPSLPFVSKPLFGRDDWEARS